MIINVIICVSFIFENVKKMQKKKRIIRCEAHIRKEVYFSRMEILFSIKN